MIKQTGIEKVVADIRLFWRQYQEPMYDLGINSRTGKHYIIEAKKEFTKYWLTDISGFYFMAERKHMVEKYGAVYKYANDLYHITNPSYWERKNSDVFWR